ncbi:MAG: tetratricopeptide repeat protein [Planctomycetota bacterium]|jgi:tetratricopeptide (TPR) repeat protein
MKNNFDNSKDDNKPTGPAPSSNADLARARSWFEKGQALVEKKNYDYAIESYISGLYFWPEAVDEGHKPCRAAALFRGGKKISLTDKIKYKTGVKDPKKAMLNAEMLLSKEPQNISHMESLFKNAARGRFDKTVMWIGQILADAITREEKPNPARFVMLREIYEELADRNCETDPPMAIEAMEHAVEALSRLKVLKPKDMEVSTDLRDVAGKLTILKGQYSTADSFRDSIDDSETQRELHDKDRVVQSDDRMEELIAQAEIGYQSDRANIGAINKLTDLLCRRENEADEIKAIGILVNAYKETNEYRLKMQADDIRIRQLNRQAREIAASKDKEAARKHLKEILRFELNAYKDRAKHYPTDLRIRYQYGVRLFRARLYDEAIPIFQEARNDPKTRTMCNLYIGRCFYRKAYYSQATDVFREAIEIHETPDDELGKDLHYWLGRTYESDGKSEDALKIYGQIIQWDYNYRDVRKRMDALHKQNGAS